MIEPDDVKQFLADHGIDATISTEARIPDMPDRLVILTVTGGAGTSHERLFDVATLQVTTRGAQRDAHSARVLASQVDGVLMAPEGPFPVGGRVVKRIDYVGGPPAFLRMDDGDRSLIGCNYLVEIARQ